MPVTLNIYCTFVEPLTIKQPRKMKNAKADTIELSGYLKSLQFENHMMELDVDPRSDEDASPTSSERMKVELFTKKDSRNTQVSIFSK